MSETKEGFELPDDRHVVEKQAEIEKLSDHESRDFSREEAVRLTELMGVPNRFIDQNELQQFADLYYEEMNKKRNADSDALLNLFRESEGRDTLTTKRAVESVVSARIGEATKIFNKLIYGNLIYDGAKITVKDTIDEGVYILKVPRTALLAAVSAADFISAAINIVPNHLRTEDYIEDTASRCHISVEAVKRAAVQLSSDKLIYRACYEGEDSDRYFLETIKEDVADGDLLGLDKLEMQEMAVNVIEKLVGLSKFKAALQIKEGYSIPDASIHNQFWRVTAIDALVKEVNSMALTEYLGLMEKAWLEGHDTSQYEPIIIITVDDLKARNPNIQDEVAQFGVTADDLENVVTYRQNFHRPKRLIFRHDDD